MSSNEMMDIDYLEKLKSGSEEAFKKLVCENHSNVMKICIGFLKSYEDAEDTAQEVFIEILRSIKSFKGNSKLSTWIYQISVSKCLDALKSKNRKKRFGTVRALFSIYEADELGLLISGLNTEKEYDENIRSEILHKALKRLPDNQRIALTLSRIQGFSNSEISEIMQITNTSVESLLHRAKSGTKKILRQSFQKYFN